MIGNLILNSNDSTFIINDIWGVTRIGFSESHLSRLYIFGYINETPCKVSFTGDVEDIEKYKNDISSLDDDYSIESQYVFYCEFNDNKGYWEIHN